MNISRLAGIVLSIIGIGIALIAGLWLAGQVAGGMSSGGALVGAGLAFIPVALLLGFGVYLFLRGGEEAKQTSTMQQQRQLLDIVKSRGQVSVSDIAIELGAPSDVVKEMVHQLVGLQVFSGYINWDKGVLYSSDADQLRELTVCRNCGGEIQLAGKGVVVCKFCGTEYFLT
jgi:Zn finger protein HypA/HybF involved in hydrogenase expression